MMFKFCSKLLNSDTSRHDKDHGLEEKKKAIRLMIAKLKDSTPEDAEIISEKIRYYCNNDNTIPLEYKKRALIQVRSLECEANMRLASAFLHKASTLRTKERLTERGRILGCSRYYYTKACLLGCETSWKQAHQRMTETIMLCGGLALNTPRKTTPINFTPFACHQTV